MQLKRLHARKNRIRAGSSALAVLMVLWFLVAPVDIPAWSYFTGTASGTGSASLGTLQPPTNLNVPATSTGTVRLDWSAAAGTPRPTGHYVTRTRVGDGAITPACSTSPTAPTTKSACIDLTVPVGEHRYTVTSVYRTWTAASAPSGTVTVSATGTPHKLEFLTHPSDTSSGVALGAQPVVAVQDVYGSIATAAPPTLVTLSISGGTLSCATSATANSAWTVDGVATFTGCTVTGPGSYTLIATATAIADAVSPPFTVAGPASKLGFATSASDSTGGIAFGTQPVVTIQDEAGRTATSAAGPVFLGVSGAPPGVILTCASNSVIPTAGIAAFSNCRLNKTGTYTLTATSGALATQDSLPFSITVGPAAGIAFTSQPSPTSTGGMPFTTQPVVSVQDVGGNTVANSTAVVNLALSGSAGATLSCSTTTRAATNGVAAFTGCGIDKSGTATLTATSPGLAPAVSTAVTTTAGPAAKLAFTASPGNGPRNSAFSRQPKVTVQDAGGNTVTTGGAQVTLGLTTPGSATLKCTGTTTNASVSGIAVFAGCQIDVAGTYGLTATSGSLIGALSSGFTMSNPSQHLAFSAEPTSGTAGTALPLQPVVTILNAAGKVAEQDTSTVTLTLTEPFGATLACESTSRQPVQGIVSFAGCTIDKPGTYTLTATSNDAGVLPLSSIPITVSAAPSEIAITDLPAAGTGATVFAGQPAATIQEAAG